MPKTYSITYGKATYEFKDAGTTTSIIKKKPVKVRKFFLKATRKGKVEYYTVEFILKGNKFTKAIFIPTNNKSKVMVFEPDSPLTLNEFFQSLKNKKTELFKIQRLSESLSGGALITVFYTLFLIGLVLYSIWSASKIKIEERKAYDIEYEIDNQLFKGRNFPALEDYATLVTAVKSLVTKDNINGVLVYGPPGTGKTYVVRRVLYDLNAPRVYFKGGATGLLDFVKVLYENKSGKIIVLDDFDSSLKNEDFINVLKAATDSYKDRVISVPQSGMASSQELQVMDIPQKFIFRSKIILITNKDKREIPVAIRSRMYSVEVNFDNKKIIDVISKSINIIRPEISKSVKEKILSDLLSLNGICKNKSFRVDFRSFSMALDLYSIYKDQYLKYFKDIVC